MTEAAEGHLAILGAGRVGGALARRCLAIGAAVTVWNRTPGKADHLREHGAQVTSVVRDAVRGASVVVSVLSDGAAVTSTFLGDDLLFDVGPSALLIELTTTDEASSRALAAAARDAGVRYVCGAVSGSPDMVQAGRASVLLSGESAAVAAAAEVCRALFATSTVVGCADEAKVVKLAVNGMVGSAVLAVAEAMVTVEAAGIARGAFVEALEHSVVWSPLVAYKSIALRENDRRITATTADLLKDVELLDAQHRKTGVQAPITEAVLTTLERAAATELRDIDCIWITSLLHADRGTTADALEAGARSPVADLRQGDRA